MFWYGLSVWVILTKKIIKGLMREWDITLTFKRVREIGAGEAR